jgi:hypothetical protein
LFSLANLRNEKYGAGIFAAFLTLESDLTNHYNTVGTAGTVTITLSTNGLLLPPRWW